MNFQYATITLVGEREKLNKIANVLREHTERNNLHDIGEELFGVNDIFGHNSFFGFNIEGHLIMSVRCDQPFSLMEAFKKTFDIQVYFIILGVPNDIFTNDPEGKYTDYTYFLTYPITDKNGDVQQQMQQGTKERVLKFATKKFRREFESWSDLEAYVENYNAEKGLNESEWGAMECTHVKVMDLD